MRVIREVSEAFKIIGASVVASVIYGILHDQITIRICPEYFTRFHPYIFPTADHTLIALGWGIIATWWIGAILGLLVTLSARIGSKSKMNVKQLRLPILAVIGGMGIAAAAVGVWYYTHPVESLFGVECPTETDPGSFYTCLAIHNTSYFMGAFLALLLCFWIILRRSSVQTQK